MNFLFWCKNSSITSKISCSSSEGGRQEPPLAAAGEKPWLQTGVLCGCACFLLKSDIDIENQPLYTQIHCREHGCCHRHQPHPMREHAGQERPAGPLDSKAL